MHMGDSVTILSITDRMVYVKGRKDYIQVILRIIISIFVNAACGTDWLMIRMLLHTSLEKIFI